jgi:hypothetical protein
VAFYELAPPATTSADLSNLVGTLSRDNQQVKATELSALEINAPGVRGKASLRGEGDLKFLQLNVDSEQANEFHVGLAGTGLAFGGFAHPDVGGGEQISYSQGNFSISNAGATSFTVILTGQPGESAGGEDVVLSITREGEGIYRGALSH